MAYGERDLELHRPLITGHCYRMLGSIADADDAVQETMIRAWKGLERFDGRAALRTWLVRIATNVCLDALAERKRRFRPVDEVPVGTVDGELVTLDRAHWLEPVPDARVFGGDPVGNSLRRESVRLAFVAALQALPPKQRAALLLSEVLGFSAVEIAETLETTVAAVNSALQRARATVGAPRFEGPPAGLTSEEEALLARYLDAFERYDVDALTATLRDDVRFSMPPYALWLRGPEAVRAWLLGRGAGCRGSRILPTAANGQPAFGQYRPGGEGQPHRPWALAVLEIEGGKITSWTSFLDTETLFPRFGLPLEL
jgi:RNA polymerase sigma-70 factor, ECF subfamily